MPKMIKTKHKPKKDKLSRPALVRRLKYMRKHYIGDIECLNDLIRDLSEK